MPTRLSDEVSRARDGIGESNRNNRRKVRSPCPYRSGFTLVELLTTIGIIAIVAAILFPVFARARESARRATCTSNLRQIGVALAMYTSDNNGTFPPSSTSITARKTGKLETVGQDWGQLITPNLGGAHASFPFCPDRELPGDFAYWNAYPQYSGYAYNGALSLRTIQTTYVTKRGSKQFGFAMAGAGDSAISFPSLVVAVEEARTGILDSRLPDSSQIYLLATIRAYGYENLFKAQSFGALRHSGGANYLFVDGHIRWYAPTAISVLSKCDGVHPGMSL